MKKIIAFIRRLRSSINVLIFKNRQSELDFSALENEIILELASFTSLSKVEKEKKNSDIKKMIEYINNLTMDIEARRSKLVEFSWQIIPILLTATGLLVALKLRLSILIPVLILFCIQLIASLYKLVVYQIQSGFRYPFLSVSRFGNKWKWFYYGNKEIVLIDPTKNKQENVEHYLKGLSIFINQYKEEDLDTELQNNIQQLYLLQVHNYFKNKFYLRLNSIDIKASRISTIFILLILGLFLGMLLSLNVFNLVNFNFFTILDHF